MLLSLSEADATNCQIVSRLEASADLRFSDIRGTINKDGTGATNFSIPEGDCDIRFADDNKLPPIYECIWEVSRNKSDVVAMYKDLVSSIEKCVQPTRSISTANGADSDATYIAIRNGRIILREDKNNGWWGIEFEYELR
jgi:hypothetical protein